MKNDSSGVCEWESWSKGRHATSSEHKNKVYDDSQHCFNGFSCIRRNGINLKLFSFRLCIEVDVFDISTVRWLLLHFSTAHWATYRCERAEQKVNGFSNFSSLSLHLAVVQCCSGMKRILFFVSSFIHKLDPNLYVLCRVLPFWIVFILCSTFSPLFFLRYIFPWRFHREEKMSPRSKWERKWLDEDDTDNLLMHFTTFWDERLRIR